MVSIEHPENNTAAAPGLTASERRPDQHPERNAGNGILSPAQPLVYNIDQVAAYLQISPSLAYRQAAAGKIPGTLRIGRRLVVSRARFTTWVNLGTPEVAR